MFRSCLKFFELGGQWFRQALGVELAFNRCLRTGAGFENLTVYLQQSIAIG